MDELTKLIHEMGQAVDSGVVSHTQLHKFTTRLNAIYRQTGSGQALAEMVREWVETGNGKFYTNQLCAELGLVARQDKKAADMALRRMAEQGVIKPCSDQRGCWRPITNIREKINWREADPTDIIDLKWPLKLEQHFTLYPTNIVICAGEKNSGKTAFVLNTAYMNHDIDLPITYFSSEMAAQELAVRIGYFKKKERFDNVSFYPLDVDSMVDVIEPDSINIVDFLEIEDEFWKVARRIRQVWQKLRRGIAIICIQKDPDARYGRGKAFSTEKARVYLTMTKKQNMTLEEVKNYKGDKKPDGLVIPYQFGEDGMLRATPRVAAPRVQRRANYAPGFEQ